MSPDVTTGHMTPPTPSTVTPKEAREAGECGEGEPCSPQRPSLNAGWPAEAETSWITEHKDDPDEEGPQSEDDPAEELGQHYDAES